MICITCGKNEAVNDFYKECQECIEEFQIQKAIKEDVFVYVCDECDETLDVGIESEFAKIPFEGIWSCKCGNTIRVKWDGKELKYL